MPYPLSPAHAATHAALAAASDAAPGAADRVDPPAAAAAAAAAASLQDEQTYCGAQANSAAIAAAVSTDTLASMSDTHPAATQSEVPPIQRQPGIWCGSYCVCVCVCVHLLGQGLVRVEGRASLCVGLCMVICGAVG